MTQFTFTLCDLHNFSKTNVTFYICPFPKQRLRKELLIKFSGEIRKGSQGRIDCLSMLAKAKSGVILVRPSGLILDFSAIRYPARAPVEMLFDAANQPCPDRILEFVLLASKENVLKIRILARKAFLAYDPPRVFVTKEEAMEHLIERYPLPSDEKIREVLKESRLMEQSLKKVIKKLEQKK